MRPTGGVHPAVDGLIWLSVGLLLDAFAVQLLRGQSLRMNGRPLSLATRPLAGYATLVVLAVLGLGATLIGLLRLLTAGLG